MKDKKGSEMSMNLIIIAVISLLVLAIIAYLIFGVPEKVNKDCENVGGECMPECDDGYLTLPGLGNACSIDGYKCCKSTGLTS